MYLEPRVNECGRNWNVLNILDLLVCACAVSAKVIFRKCAGCLEC